MLKHVVLKSRFVIVSLQISLMASFPSHSNTLPSRIIIIMMIIITTTTTAMTLIYGDNNYIPRIVEENANSQHVVCHAQLDFLSLFRSSTLSSCSNK